MGLSKIRQIEAHDDSELSFPPEGDAKPYEVFIQLNRGQPHVHSGTVDAVDGKMALSYAKKHFGRDQECVHMWVVPREAMISTNYDGEIIWPLTDQGYRLVRGYAIDVRRKWERFRDQEELDRYQDDDIKEMF